MEAVRKQKMESGTPSSPGPPRGRQQKMELGGPGDDGVPERVSTATNASTVSTQRSHASTSSSATWASSAIGSRVGSSKSKTTKKIVDHADRRILVGCVTNAAVEQLCQKAAAAKLPFMTVGNESAMGATAKVHTEAALLERLKSQDRDMQAVRKMRWRLTQFNFMVHCLEWDFVLYMLGRAPSRNWDQFPKKVLATSNNSENSSIKRALLVHYSADSTAEPAELSAAFLNGVRGVTYDSADFTPEMSRLTDEELMSSSSLPAMKWALMQAGIPPTEHGVTDEKHIPIFFDVCGDMERRVVVQYLLLYHCRAVQRARLKLAFGIVRRKLMFNIAPNIAKALREAERFEARYRTYRVLQDVRARPLVLCTVSWMARLMEVQQRSETRLNETVLRWRFGCAVIDEAGTCPRSFLPVLLSMGIRKLVFVGDPDQLPPYLDALPVVGSRIDRHTEQGRIQDLHGNGGRGDQAVTNGSTAKDHPAVTKRTNGDEDHQAVFIPGQVGATDPPRDSATPAGDQYPTVMLCQNYRMPTTIQKLVGRLFYDDRLRSFDGQTAGKFTWFDVGAAQNAFESSAGSSRINLVEAAFLLLRLQSFAAPQKSVLVLSFYRAQKLLIYTLVEQFFPDWLHSKKIRVCTIDEAQGSEQKRVFLTTVRCENERGQLVGGGATAGSARKAFGGGGGSLGFVTDRRRLNVGLSRSSQELTIVGSVGTLADRDFKWAAVRDAGTVKVPSDDLVGSAVAKFMPQVKQTARRLFGAGADQRVVDNSGGRRARGGRGWRGGGEKDAIGRNVGGLEAFRKGSNGGGKGGGAPFAPAARPRQPAWGAGPGAEAGKKAAEKFSPAKQEKTGGKNGGKGHGQGGKDSSRSEKGNKRGKGRGRSGTPSSPGTSPRVGSSPSSNKGSSSWGKRKDGCIGSK